MIILEGQPDERRLIQTVDVGSEQNEVVVLRTGRSFLCALRSAGIPILARPPRPVAAIPAPSPRPPKTPEGGRTPSLAERGRTRKKKSPARPKGGAGVNSQRGRTPRRVEPIRRGSGCRRLTRRRRGPPQKISPTGEISLNPVGRMRGIRRGSGTRPPR